MQICAKYIIQYLFTLHVSVKLRVTNDSFERLLFTGRYIIDLLDKVEIVSIYGAYMKPYLACNNNFLKVRMKYLYSIFGNHIVTEARASMFNVDYFFSPDFH